MKILPLSVLLLNLCFINNNLFAHSRYEIIHLENTHIKIGILLHAGGRMVYFGAVDGGNFLLSDSTLWNQSDKERIKPTPKSDFFEYNGQITWVSPQSEWWLHQNINKKRYREKSNWPPDPYLIYGVYTIQAKTDTSLVIIGEPSPVTGLRLTKTFMLKGNKLYLHVRAENTRKEAVHWGLWNNSRFPGHAQFYVAANNSELKQITFDEKNKASSINHRFINGFFTFSPPPDTALQQEVYWSKAFLNPKTGHMAVIDNNHLLHLTFSPVPNTEIHPTHAFIEVFCRIGRNASLNLLELEHHSAYQRIPPGETIELEEQWTIHAINRSNSENEQIQQIKKIINLK